MVTSDPTADGIRLDGERNPIGWRTESDRTADGIRLDGGRKRLNTDYKNIIIRHKEFKRHLKNTPNNPRIPHNFCNFTRVLP